MVALVVRDRAWRTLSPQTGSVRTRLRDDGHWTVRARTQVDASTLHWRLVVAPRDDGIDVSASMAAEGDVVTNRAGLVVLLPTAVFAGARYVAQHAHGDATRGRLPTSIAPHQPLVDLAGVRLHARDGMTLRFAFEGEVFEMEDQRNWLDPTFKLYSRALSRPIPYRMRDGACVRQTAAIDLERAAARTSRSPSRSVRGRLPSLGVATAPGRVPRERRVVAALVQAGVRHIVHRTTGTAVDVVKADALAAALSGVVVLECFGTGEALAEAVSVVRPAAIASHQTTRTERKALHRRSDRSARVGGTFADFVMLNRNGIEGDAQRVVFALCPTVHARDDRSLVETLDALPEVLAQAKRIAGRRPLDIGPCSLRRRLWPRTGRPVEDDVDPRQDEAIAAAWLASLVALASVAGVDRLCAFEAAGPRGIVHNTQSGALRTPAHAVLAALASHVRGSLTLYGVRACAGAAFVLHTVADELWLVDLQGRSRTLPPSLGAARHIVATGGDATWSRPASIARLPAYGIARIALPRRDDRRLARMAARWCEATGTRA
jgi:hypothetical protein